MVHKSLWYKMLICYCVVVVLGIALVQIGTQSVTTVIEHLPNENRTCIAIDAGHGGIDGGAVSVSGIPESQINLQIAQRLNDLLHFMGYKTFMLRDDDTSLHTEGVTISSQKISDLKHRVQMVADSNASLLISIHQNTFSDNRYSGAQVFHPGDSDSITLATRLQENLIITVNNGSKRKPKLAKGIYLMEHINCPALLIECGFLTNLQEEAQLRKPEYQKKLSGIIAATISSHWH